ncbi:hypothetical protein [Aromatoleum petrolei]|uniref:Uncharacterized protein n=1 Tax=Aromatoleum petrolei TaxID=76116 RepID=A0ABX1MMG9_9RHOO|nr:hypothetical protein [Aromatoleum petrolei]NMF87886.1 hypothetical protein [Aromatoleum petrolei]
MESTVAISAVRMGGLKNRVDSLSGGVEDAYSIKKNAKRLHFVSMQMYYAGLFGAMSV